MKLLKLTMPLLAILVLGSCTKERKTIIPPGSDVGEPTHFEFKQTDGVWKMYKNGEEFFVHGAATNRNYKKVKEFGGNAFRTYSTSEDATPPILSEAYRNGLYVNMGLYVAHEKDGFDYNNEEKVAEQLEKFRTIVRKFRNHPSVMCWSLGNEAEASYTNHKLWTAINDIAKMVHEEDPYHPTTTVLAGANVNNIKLIVDMAPELDFLCVNSYYPATANVKQNIESGGWTKPWMITEFGPRGTWNSPPTTSWGALIEETSTQKASFYKKIMEEDIYANKNDGCLGSFAFVWGYQNHGEVLTWYGLFDKNGNSFGAVDEIQYFWTGSYPGKLAPVIADRNAMTMNDKIADDSIIVTPKSENTAKVQATSPWGSALTYKWMIYLEGTASADGSLPDGLGGLIKDDSLDSITFTAPDAVGNYRLCVFVTDSNHKVALSVIPFCVKK